MKALSWLYYRYVFLRENPIARAVGALAGSPAVPSREAWESQYENGEWTRLNDLSEQAHNGVVLSYIAYLRPVSSILEIGCGEGILLPRLRQIGYRSYTGVDISEVAIGKAGQFRDQKTAFLVGDAEAYQPNAAFDVIVLNECIYYFVEPIRSLQQYANCLAPGGLFVISLFDKYRTRPIRRSLKSVFRLVDETVISNAKGTWYCLVLSPKESNLPTAAPAKDFSTNVGVGQ